MTKSKEQSIKDKVKTISREQNRQFGEVWQAEVLMPRNLIASVNERIPKHLGGWCLTTNISCISRTTR